MRFSLVDHLAAVDLARCFLGRSRSQSDVHWLAGTLERCNQSFQSDGDSGFQWIIAHAMCLFHELDNNSNVTALACLCISAKLLDDRCAEIGDGVWETQLPGLTPRALAEAEQSVLHAFAYKVRRKMCVVETCFENMAISAGVAVCV